MEKENNRDILNKIISKYNLEVKERNYLKKLINPIIIHPEFQRRMTKEFPHHGDISLGEHIIEDSIVTYKLAKLKNNIRMDLAIRIAMFHDLYTINWQNNNDAKVKHFFHKHGFRHPIEAVINAINWYPEYFSNYSEANIIIDGIIHHMFPLPVLRVNDNVELLELRNYSLYQKLNTNYQNMIKDSLQRKRVGPVSFSRSLYPEGRIMAKADRIVSRKQIKDFQSMKSLVTGHNKNLNK